MHWWVDGDVLRTIAACQHCPAIRPCYAYGFRFCHLFFHAGDAEPGAPANGDMPFTLLVFSDAPDGCLPPVSLIRSLAELIVSARSWVVGPAFGDQDSVGVAHSTTAMPVFRLVGVVLALTGCFRKGASRGHNSPAAVFNGEQPPHSILHISR